jgi:hypothetical protein
MIGKPDDCCGDATISAVVSGHRDDQAVCAVPVGLVRISAKSSRPAI